MSKKITLTESKLRKIISEAVKNILSEGIGAYAITFLRGNIDDITAQIQENGGLLPPENVSGMNGKGIYLFDASSPEANSLRTYGNVKITVDLNKASSLGAKISADENEHYRRVYFTKFLPADSIVDIANIG